MHLVVWWAETQEENTPSTNPVRCDLLGLAKLPEGERKAFYQVISSQTAKAVRLLQSLRRQTQSNPYQIEIYGVFGHSTLMERERSGLSRGPQSGLEGHLNAVLFEYGKLYEAVTVEQVVDADRLKQIGPWDTLIYDRLGPAIEAVIAKKIKQRLGETIKFSVKANSDYGRPHEKKVSFFEGFRIDFEEEIDQVGAMGILTDLVGDFEEFYQRLIGVYKDYHKAWAWGDKDKLAEFERNIDNYVRNFGFEADSVVVVKELVESIQATYGQIRKWINEIDPENDDERANIRRLEKRKAVYERRNSFLNQGKPDERQKQYIRFIQVRHGIGEEQARAQLRERYINYIRRLYGIDEKQAELLIRLTGDRYKDPMKESPDIWFTWPRHISGTYMFERYRLGKDGRIKVKSINIALRAATTKGAVEDALGVLPKRVLAT